jgi:hypothetical protein
VLVTGSTTDNLFAVNPNPGTSDLYLARFDTSGSLLSSVQFGAVSQEFNSSLTLDAADAIYVAGSTDGPFAGPYLGGFSDVFVMKLVVPEPSGSAILVAASVAASVRTLSRSTRPRCGRP